MTTIPEFGTTCPGAEYVLRPGGYAIILRASGEVAVVATPVGLTLPGGGQEPGEAPDSAAVRESAEECGLRIEVGRLVGVADELVYADGERTHFRKRCTFFLAELTEADVGGEADHELRWLPPAAAVASLRHESQRWAVAEACRLTSHNSEPGPQRRSLLT